MSYSSRGKDQPAVVKLTKLQMDAMVSEIVERMKVSDNHEYFFQNAQAMQDVKIKRRSRIPSFCGKNDDYSAWELKMELVFDGQNYSEGKKVRLATKELCGDAIQWWNQLVTTRKRTGEAQVASWFELKHFMKKQFASGNYSTKPVRQAKMETRSFHIHEQPSKLQSPRHKSSNKRPPSACEGPKPCSKQEQVFQKLKTKPTRVKKESETENKFSLVSPQTDFIINSSFDELTVLEPVHPSNLVSIPQVLTENAAEERQESLPQEEDSEQPNNIEPETNIESFLLDFQEHCKEVVINNFVPEMFVKVSLDEVKRFGLEKVKEFCVSNSVFDNMIQSFKKTEPDKIFDQKRFHGGVDSIPGLVLSFDKLMEEN